MGDRRNILIDQFHEYKGKSYIPSTMHKAIRWSKSDPFLEWQENVDWQVIDLKTDSVSLSTDLPPLSKNASETLPSTPDVISGSQGIVSPVKHKISYIVPAEKKQRIKKIKFNHLTDHDDQPI
jgi:hypothetical protein